MKAQNILLALTQLRLAKDISQIKIILVKYRIAQEVNIQEYSCILEKCCDFFNKTVKDKLVESLTKEMVNCSKLSQPITFPLILNGSELAYKLVCNVFARYQRRENRRLLFPKDKEQKPLYEQSCWIQSINKQNNENKLAGSIASHITQSVLSDNSKDQAQRKDQKIRSKVQNKQQIREHEEQGLKFPDEELIEKAALRLFSFDVTDTFKDELAQVKALIKDQASNNDYFKGSFRKFVKKYRQFHSILELNSQAMAKKFEEYQSEYLVESNRQVKYALPVSKSDMYTQWTISKQNIEKELEEEKNSNIQDCIQAIIMNNLEKIILFYTPGYQDDPLYGQSDSSGIYINLNHINAGLSIEDFRKGPLKPYLYNIIVHQLGHRVIRELEIVKDDVENSFELDQNTFGRRLYKHLIKMAPSIKMLFKQLKISINHQFYRQNLKILEKTFQQAITFVKGGLDTSQKLQDYFDQILNVKKMLKSLHTIELAVESLYNNEGFQSWQKLIDIINKYQKTDSVGTKEALHKERQELSRKKSQEIDLNFVFGVLIYAQFLALPFIHYNYQQYRKAQNKVVLNRGFPYLCEEKKIVQTIFKQIQPLYKHLYESGLLESFTEMFCQEDSKTFLSKDYFPQLLMRKMQGLNQKFDEEELQKYLKAAKNVPLLNGPSANANLMIMKPSPDLQKTKDILRVEEYYNRLMSLLKKSQMFIIASQVPDLYYLQLEAITDSGQYLQRSFFPQLKAIYKLYGKDFQLMRHINQANARNIGKPHTEGILKKKNQIDYKRATKRTQ